jgi:predicted HicB family RNase H-like nuclease
VIAAPPAPARGGRPALAPEQRHSEQLWSRVTPALADAVCRAAVREGLSVSEFVRIALERAVVVNEKPSTT